MASVSAPTLHEHVLDLQQKILTLNKRMVAVYDVMPPKAQADFKKFSNAQLMFYKELDALTVYTSQAAFDDLAKRLKIYFSLAPKFEQACSEAEKLWKQALEEQEQQQQLVPVYSDADRQEMLLMNIDMKLGDIRRQQLEEAFRPRW